MRRLLPEQNRVSDLEIFFLLVRESRAMEGAGVGSETAPLTWPSVLSFLQHEYRRFELERSEHALEVASLKVRFRSTH